MENLGINLGYVLLQICMFGIVFVVLRAWVYKPILDLLDRRSKAIAQGLEDSRVAAEARQNAEAEANRIISEAQARASQMVKEATDRADLAAREVKSASEAEASRIREAALQEVEMERTRVLGEVRNQVVTLAIAAAQKVINESLDEERQHALIDEFFSGVRAGRISMLNGSSFSGTTAEVTSALPLTAVEQETIRRDLLSRLAGEGTVTFRVDPTIMGGIIVRAGDKVMDGSVAGRLQNLRQALA